ncbi:MAG: hypothetical protein U1C70_04170 [Sediminibacterium sp.]|uniref:hypothetical protein n=1 Tax=Sediminibacterium sp. TaxID=1917865 RepID=UPI002ABBAEC5|nr:hypothetical protein [Sediminibacterium sp.]MDZ4071004.1 hypothetical protein [Sediminibacterium sp.]
MKSKMNPQLSGAVCLVVPGIVRISQKMKLLFAFLVMVLLSITSWAQPNLSASKAKTAGSNSEIDPLYQSLYNMASIAVVIVTIISLLKPIKGLMSSEAGGQGQGDGERKGHLMTLMYIGFAQLIWWLGVPYLIKVGFTG